MNVQKPAVAVTVRCGFLRNQQWKLPRRHGARSHASVVTHFTFMVWREATELEVGGGRNGQLARIEIGFSSRGAISTNYFLFLCLFQLHPGDFGRHVRTGNVRHERDEAQERFWKEASRLRSHQL